MSAPAPATLPFTVVTGGSEGIGLAIAARFALAGHNLLLIARDGERLSAAADTLRNRGARHIHTLALDITTPEAISALEHCLSACGAHVEILVNAAGTGLSGAFDSHSADAVDRLVALNVAALTRLMRHSLPGMRSRRSGGVLNIASLGGYVPGPYQAAYYASKAYVIALSEAVAAEAAADGVRVTVSAPGPVATRFHAKMDAEACLYRRLIPAASPDTIALWSVLAFNLGIRTIAPRIQASFMLVFLRVLPHRILVPVVAWLLRPRQREGLNA